MKQRSLEYRHAVAVVALAMLIFGGCGRSNPNIIEIVSSLPRTGSARQQSDTIVNGIRMALDEADENPQQPGWQVAGFDIEYRDMDDATAIAGAWTSERETANAIKASQDVDVMAYIGTFNSGAAKVAMPILNRAGLLMISPANTAVELTNPDVAHPRELAGLRPSGRINFCRIVPSDDKQARFGAEWTKELGFSRVVVLDDNEVYGKGLATLYAENCERLGLNVVYRDSIEVRSQEFRSLMTRIKSYDPELIYFGGTTQSKGGQLAKDMVEAGLNCKMMVPDGCYELAFIESAGERIDGRIYVTFGGLPPSEQRGAGGRFVERYRGRFSVEPEVYAIYGYEAALALLDTIRRVGKKDREAILQACLATKDFSKGALGTWSFDANGDITNAQLSGSIVQNGAFVFLKQWTPDENARQ